MQALRVLSEQTHLLDCSAEGVTDGVHVEMTSRFMGVGSFVGVRPRVHVCQCSSQLP